jgi:hypothetical protein
MDDSGSSIVYDRSQNQNNANFNGTLNEKQYNPGISGYGLYFDGSGYLTTDDATFDLTDDFTLSAWVNRGSGGSGERQIIAKRGGAGGSGGFSLSVGNGGNVYCRTDDGSTLDTSNTDASTVDANSGWVHLSAVKSGESCNVYVDGIDKTTTFDSHSTPGTNNDSLRVGAATTGSTEGWIGMIDEVKIYNYARSQESIIKDMNLGHPAPGSPIGSPVLWLKFDEGYGDTAYDVSPQGNNGNLGASTTCPQAGDSACPSWTNDGRFGKALDFDTAGATDDYVEIGDPIISSSYPFTVSTWVNVDTTASNHGVISLADESVTNHFYTLRVNGGGGVRLDLLNGGQSDSVDSINTITAGEWNHMVGVFTSSTERHLYLNGKLEASSTTTVDLGTGLDVWNIGRYADSTPIEYLNGRVDEVKIYNFALSADQIATEYNQGKAEVFGSISTTAGGSEPSFSADRMYCPPGDSDSSCGGPVAEWPLNEYTGEYAYDTSGGGYTGTLGASTVPDSADPKWFNNCKYGNCLTYDGTDDYIDIGTGPTTVRSIEMWVYPETTTEYLMNLTSTTDYLWINGSTVTATNVTSPTIYVDGVQTTYITADEWHQVVVTTSTAENASNLDIGRTADANYMQGNIDNVLLYDYVRTPAQVSWSYNKGEPIAWYRFDACQGDTLYDITNNQLNGTINAGSGPNSSAGTCSSGAGDEMWDNGTTGKFGASLDFDGSDDYVSLGDQTWVDNKTFTYAAWLNLDSYSSDECSIISKWNGSNNRHAFRVSTGGRLEIITTGAVGPYYDATADSVIPTTSWVHVAVTADGSDGEVDNFYINGKIYELATNDNLHNLNDTSDEFTIGRRADNSDECDGQIDDVRIYNYALTQQQINDIYNYGSSVRFD